MLNLQRTTGRATVAAISLLLLPCSFAFADDVRQKTLADWQNRLKRVRAVRYTIKGTEENKNNEALLADSAKQATPTSETVVIPPDSKTPIELTVVLDLRGRHFRIEKSQTVFSQARKGFVPTMSTSSYDGKVYQTAIPRGVNRLGPDDPDIHISKGDLAQQTVEPFIWPLFEAHGLVPTVNLSLRPDKLPDEHEPDEFDPRGNIQYLGRSFTILRTEPINASPSLADELWVDPGRQSAIVRHVYFGGRKPWLRLDVAFQETAQGWLPKTWTCTWTPGGLVARIQALSVESIEFDPPMSESDFTLPIKPGMIVLAHDYAAPGSGLDPTRPGTATYRVDPSGRWVELGSQGFTTTEGVQLPPESKSRRWWWIGTLCLAFVVILGTVSLWSWRRRQR